MCALLATLLRQWAHRYVTITQTRWRHNPHKQGRIRAYVSEGVEKLHLPWVVDALPSLLHLSFFLFFAGLLVFLFNIDSTVFSAVVWSVGLCAAVYLSVTFMPLFRYDSPYYSPLSTMAWFLAFGVLTALLEAFSQILGSFGTPRKERFVVWRRYFRKLFADGFEKTTKEFALKVPSEIDGRALMWLLQRVDSDQKLERFFKGILGLGHSQIVDVASAFLEPLREKVTEALLDLVHHTFTFEFVTAEKKRVRLDMCKEAMKTAPYFRVTRLIFHRFVNSEWRSLLTSIEFARMLRRVENNDPPTLYYSRIMLSIILPGVPVQERDKRWYQLASSQLNLGVTRPVLDNYVAHGNSIHLANCIHVLRNLTSIHFDYWRGDPTTLQKTLALVSNFDIRDTLPELQNDFCREWNRIVEMGGLRIFGSNRDASQYIAILKNIHHLYIALHPRLAPTAPDASTPDERTNLSLASSYPRCDLGHSASRSRDPATGATAQAFPIPRPTGATAQTSPYLQQHTIPPIASTIYDTQGNILHDIPHPASLSRDPVTGATAQASPHLQQHIVPPIASTINTPLPPEQWQ
jgi:hypothetical protein